MKGFSRNNVKLTYTGVPEFYINENKRTVVCKLHTYVATPVDETHFRGISLRSFSVNAIGRAKCSKDDEFDVERGKRIALGRAKSNIYIEAIHNITEQAEKLKYLHTICADFVKKAYTTVAVHDEYVDSLTFPAHPDYKKTVLPLKSGKIINNTKK